MNARWGRRLLAGAFALAAGCRSASGPGPAPSGSAPGAATTAWAAYRCTSVAPFATPLVVDFTLAERRRLLAALERGVPAVRYDCQGLTVVEGCTAPGRYETSTLAGAEAVVGLVHPAEVAANLPRRGFPGAPVKLTLATPFVRRTLAEAVIRSELAGSCAGVTHVVRGVQLGAFAATGGGEAQGGDFAACRRRRPGDATLPPACRAAVRLELAPVVADEATLVARLGEARTHLVPRCPSGLVAADGRCTVAEAVERATCRFGDRPGCEAQCAAGDMPSCAAFGLTFALGLGGERDPVRAASELERACRGGSQVGCVHLAALLTEGQGARRDTPRAQRLLAAACRTDPALGCYELGFRYYGVRDNAAASREAARYFQRACSGGVAQGCNALGYLLAEGRGVPADPTRALALFTAACAAHDQAACDSVGEALEKGWGTPPDPERARAQYQRACDRGVRSSCASAQRLAAQRQ